MSVPTNNPRFLALVIEVADLLTERGALARDAEVVLDEARRLLEARERVAEYSPKNRRRLRREQIARAKVKPLPAGR